MTSPPPEDKGGDGSVVEPAEMVEVSARPSRAMPPPIPLAAATKRGFVVPNLTPAREVEAIKSPLRRRLESPTVLERALRERTDVDLPAKAVALQGAVDAAAASDRTAAAFAAYELGELFETRLRDEDRALEAYTRAAELDVELRAASWSLRRVLYRRNALADVARVIDKELATAKDAERLDLLVERAVISDDSASGGLDAVIAANPGQQVALLALERMLAAPEGSEALYDVWRRLAEVVRHPARKFGYLLDLAWGTRTGFDAAARVGGPHAALRVAQQQLRCIAAGGTSDEVDVALQAYTQTVLEALDKPSPMATTLERELVAVCWLRARHVRAERPTDAWAALQQAWHVAHGDPLLVVEQLELARAAGRESDVPLLVQLWKSVEDAAARQAIVSRWSALAFAERERRTEWRALIAATNSAVSGWIVTAGVAECDVLTGPRDVSARGVLAERYLAAARAAARGTWLGAERAQSDPAAAVALYVQAADVFANYLLDGDDLESAHSALDEARELVPGHPAVHEATVELKDSAGEPQEAIERLRATATKDDNAPLVRALRIARTHGLTKVVFDLERALLDHSFDPRLAWEHESTLVQLGRDDERADLLVRIGRAELDHQRKYMALLGAARLYVRLGASETSISLLRELRALEPRQQYPQEALTEALRRAQLWPELVAQRTLELTSEGGRPRAALRELSWVQEVCLRDPAAAAKAYAEWVTRMPGDHVALEGLARCSTVIGDTAAVVRAHEALAGEGSTAAGRWLLARSYARAGMHDKAIAEYRDLAENGREYVALTAALALVAIATRLDDGALRAFGTSELASRTSDSRLAGVLYEEVGWFYALSSDETERAATSFAEAAVRDPSRAGALVGCTLIAAAKGDGGELARRYADLAEAMGAGVEVDLKLRAAAVAAVEGDGRFADEQLFSALASTPKNAQAAFVMVETDVERQHTETNPFAVSDHMVERGKMLATRAEIVEDPAKRTAYELDRAEVLEIAGHLRDAAAIVTSVVRAFPKDRRALHAMRRLTRATDPDAFARASYVLATVTRDVRWKLELLGDAATVFATTGGSRSHAIAALEAIRALSPDAPELASIAALLREHEGLQGPVTELTRELVLAAGEVPLNGARLIELLLERVELVRRYDLRRAFEDLDAILAYTPSDPGAMRLRRALTNDTSFVQDVTDSIKLDSKKFERHAKQVEAVVAQFASDDPTSESSGLDYTTIDAPDPFASSTVSGNLPAVQDDELEILEAREIPGPAEFAALATRPLEDIADILGREPQLDRWDLQLPASAYPLTTDRSEFVVATVDQQPSFDTVEQSNLQLVDAYTREAEASTEPVERAAMWTEAGRIWDRLGEWSRAKTAYEAALSADPGWSRALRGARRLAYRERDLVEVLALLEREVNAASGLERRSLQRFRIDLLLATREHGAASVAIADLLAHDSSEHGVWFAALVAGFVDGDAQATDAALAALGRAFPSLATSMGMARAHMPDADDNMEARDNQGDDPIGQHWQALSSGLARNDAAAAVAAALDLALHVEGEDPTTTTALAMIAQLYATETGTLAPALHEPALEAAKLSARIAPREPLVVRLAAETALMADDLTTAAHSFAQWARTKTNPAERAYAAARAAELEPIRLGRMWATVVEQYPDDDYAVSKVRAHHVAAGKLEDVIAVELRSAREGGRLASMIDAAETMVEETRVDEAIETLAEARERWPGSLAAVEVQAETLASVGRWVERAKVLDEAASVRGPSVGARDVLYLRAAAAWDLAALEATGARLDSITISALLACERVLSTNPASAFAHGTALKLARVLPDRRALVSVLGRLAAAEPSPWARASLTLRRLRIAALVDPEEAREIARTVAASEDPRRSVCFSLAFDPPLAADVALSLDARADHVETGGSIAEAATLRMRAAFVAAETGDVDRALALCQRFASVLPGVAADLEGALGKPRVHSHAMGFTRLVRDADDGARGGDAEGAFTAYRRAIELRPSDPVALLGHALVGARVGKPLRAAVEQLEAAEASKDSAAELAAYEHFARAATGLTDRSGLIAALRHAVRLDPARLDLYAWLEREVAMSGDLATLLHLRREIIARTAKWATTDRVAMLVDTALLALRLGKEEDVTRLSKAVLDAEPQHPLALRQLESALRAASPSVELASLHERIASVVDGPSTAAALTRAGEVYALLGKHEDAAAAFARSIAVEPRYHFALDAWRASALDGSRWADLFAIARSRDAAGTPTTADFHLAGVALMESSTWRDHADEAIAALRRVLQLDSGHADAFLRLWIMLDALGRREELVELLRARVAVATERDERIGLHRELAHRLFTIEPTAAMHHYRSIVTIDPADVRAHAAIADLASAHAPWSAAADAVAARIPLEQDPRDLQALHTRLGAIYAEHDDKKALDAYQRAAEHGAEDASTLEQIARIATRLREWPVALAASERLVVAEKDPTKLAEHLVRSATVFASGFSNIERAARMLQLALETAPTDTAALDGLVDLLGQSDSAALRGQLERIVAVLRARLEADPSDGPAYRMLSRASAARASMGDVSALVTARAAAEMAALFGLSEARDAALLARAPTTARARLAQPAADLVLVPDSIPTELLAMLRVAAPAIKQVAGVELAAFGVQRKQRLRATDPLFVTVRAVAAPLGFGELDVYLGPQPYSMIAEPGDPVAVVIGHVVAQYDGAITHAAAAALKLAQLSLAIPARLTVPALTGLVLALFEVAGVANVGASTPETDALTTRLRKQVSSSARAELERHARALQVREFPGLSRDLQVTGLRAGFAASGQLRAGLDQLAGVLGVDAVHVVSDVLARNLVSFALSEKAATLLTSG